MGYSPFKSLSTLYALIKAGKIKVVVRGDENRKKYFIQGKDIVTFAESQKITITQTDVKLVQKNGSKAKR